MTPRKVSPLMAFYGVCTVLGAVVPWYFNIQFMQRSGETITPQKLLMAGFTSPLASSLMTDFIIGTTAAVAFMIVEARRLKMRLWGLYIVAVFLVAFAFAFPLFLLMRERRLREIESVAD